MVIVSFLYRVFGFSFHYLDIFDEKILPVLAHRLELLAVPVEVGIVVQAPLIEVVKGFYRVAGESVVESHVEVV